MGVDMHFFLETKRDGVFWDLEAEFFIQGTPFMRSLVSPHGIRGLPTAGISTPGFPPEVSRKVVGKWGTWEREKAGYPSNWGHVEPFKDKLVGKVYPHMGVFGEGWMTTDEFESVLALYETKYLPELIKYEDDENISIYYSILGYMTNLERSDGVECRAVFFFDN